MSKDFKQFANNPVEKWQEGILQQSNSTYYEGSSTLQRVDLKNIPATNLNRHTLTLSHLATKGGHHAYDFITSYDQALLDFDVMSPGDSGISGPNGFNVSVWGAAIGSALTAAEMQALYNGPAANKIVSTQVTSGIYGAGGTSPTSAVLLLGANIGDRVAAYDASPGVGPGKRGVQLYGDQPILNAQLVLIRYTDASESYAEYELRWESTSTKMLILFAGHLALGNEFPSFVGVGYGNLLGAGAISGGPYHFKLDMLDGASLGSMDNQIKAGDIVIPPPPCTIAPQARTICDSDADPTFSGPVAAGMTYAWSISPSTPLLNANTQTVTVVNPPPGNYTLTLVTTNYGVTSVPPCTASLIVNPLPSVNNASAEFCEDNHENTVLSGYDDNIGAEADEDVVWYSDSDRTLIVTETGNLSVGVHTYYATVTNEDECDSPAELAITINAAPSVNNASAEFCEDNHENTVLSGYDDNIGA
ncbi:hypothetical protein, partial [Flavobacterium swingsii]|uniref:hypothetical protein n=1 Tax=Flavobacterium swingsii TaxID=498292 RepID=UPI001160A585